jgi:hypothetical protein
MRRSPARDPGGAKPEALGEVKGFGIRQHRRRGPVRRVGGREVLQCGGGRLEDVRIGYRDDLPWIDRLPVVEDLFDARGAGPGAPRRSWKGCGP